jgi:hypothetical protein
MSTSARRLQAVLASRTSRPKQLKITLNSRFAKMAPDKETLKKLGRAAWRVDAPLVFKEPKPQKLPGGRRAGKVEGAQSTHVAF